MKTTNNSHSDYTKIEDFLDTKVTGKLSPGVQFILADASGVLYEYNKGLADIEKNEAVTSNTQFKMYSATKLLTMIAVTQLVEEGKLKLDSAISDYLDYDYSKEVTIRKVLSHTAGFTKSPFIKELRLTTEKGFSYSDFMEEMLQKHSKLKYKPGNNNSYSNYGYLVLSALVEKVSGIKYEEYIHTNIISKVNLDKNDYLGFEFTEQTATGYQKRRTFMHWLYSLMVDTKKYYGSKTKDWQSYHDLYIKGLGFGGGFANAGALAKTFISLMNHKLLNENTLNLTFEPQLYKKNKIGKHALAWWLGKVSGYKSYHHAGGGGGYSCEVRIYPEKGIVRVMMLNKTQTFGDLRMYAKIDELWL